MAITSGFFNSVNGDRKYNSEQMSALFNGIINDGIFASIGTAFSVTSVGGNDITVGIGRAWFNGIWVNNDAIEPFTLEESEVLLNRWDAVIIEIDKTDSVRIGTVKVIKGTPATDAVYPAMTRNNDVNQYALAYIYRGANTSGITQAEITSVIGSGDTPFITGVLKVLSIDTIVAQWQSEFKHWTNENTLEYLTWFASISGTLGDDPATELAKHHVQRSILIPASGWGDTYPYENTVEIGGLLASSDLKIIGVVHGDGNTLEQDKAIDKAAGFLMFNPNGVQDGAITFRAKKKPEIDITVVTEGG